MTTYLTGGWYSRDPAGGLRRAVLDGAMDAAGLLHRAGISAEVVSQLALRVRGLARLGDAATRFGPGEREIVGRHLEEVTGDSPALVGFVADCLDHVSSAADLMAFYLHLVHITRMLVLLALAQQGPGGPTTAKARAERPARIRKTTRSRPRDTAAEPAARPSTKQRRSVKAPARKPKARVVARTSKSRR